MVKMNVFHEAASNMKVFMNDYLSKERGESYVTEIKSSVAIQETTGKIL